MMLTSTWSSELVRGAVEVFPVVALLIHIRRLFKFAWQCHELPRYTICWVKRAYGFRRVHAGSVRRSYIRGRCSSLLTLDGVTQFTASRK
jgi:hypothetical protein